MTSLTTDYVAGFQKDLEAIEQLQTTPNLVKDHAIATFDAALRQQLPHASKTILENGRRSLENISHTSIAANFKVIHAQMCVLAVSSLEATLKHYFENAANAYRNLDVGNKRLAEIKVTLHEIIASELRFGGKVGKLILEKDKPNFQDLKSIKTIFKQYFNKDVVLSDSDQKAACFYLEARHLLVHKGGVVDDKFIQATSVLDANLKGYTAGDRVELEESDWHTMREVFIALVASVTAQDIETIPN